MPIVKQTYQIDVTKKERKAFREDPLGHLDDIISKVRSEYLKDQDPEPYLFVSDLEILTGPAFLKGIEPYIVRESVVYNGNSQVRRLILEENLREVVENTEEPEDVQVNETDDQLYNVTVQPLQITIEPVNNEVIKPCDALKQLSCQNRQPQAPVLKNSAVVGQTIINIEGDDIEGQIKVLVSKEDKEKDRPKAATGPLNVPKTVAEVRAAVRPIVDAAYTVKAQRIADLCLAYSKELIKDHNYTAEDIDNKDRFPYREPRRLLYTEFERIFADDERVAKFVESRENAPKGEVDTYIKGVYAIGYIDWLLEIAETLFAPFIKQA